MIKLRLLSLMKTDFSQMQTEETIMKSEGNELNH